MANPWEFLEKWTKESVNAAAYDDRATAPLWAKSD
jgi:hypothetical protein